MKKTFRRHFIDNLNHSLPKARSNAFKCSKALYNSKMKPAHLIYRVSVGSVMPTLKHETEIKRLKEHISLLERNCSFLQDKMVSMEETIEYMAALASQYWRSVKDLHPTGFYS